MIINDSRKVVVTLVEWFLMGVPHKLRDVENKYYSGGMLQYVLSCNGDDVEYSTCCFYYSLSVVS